jgi:hypothetical protein
LYSINKSKKPKKISLFLAKPDMTIIGKITDTNNKKHRIKFNEINELSFTIPYETDVTHKLVRNSLVDLIKERYLIKVVIGDVVEWYVIVKKSKSFSDSDLMSIECMSLGYELSFQRIIEYQAASYNCTQVTSDCLKGTIWKIGYINPNFNTVYRQFDVSSKTKLDFLYEIVDAFKAHVVFDTVNRLVNIYSEEEISQYKGLWIKFGQYLESVEETIDIDQVYTRLEVRGSDGLTINAVNPTGKSYIDDFSYFIYPFERDVNRNVITKSDFMSDTLCHALLDYNELIETKKNEFSSLLFDKNAKQEQLTTEENTLTTLNDELIIILDEIVVLQETGGNTSTKIAERDAKVQEINDQKVVIDGIKSVINNINTSITSLRNELSEVNNFTQSQLDELNYYIKVEEWSDDNLIDENDLYSEAIKKLSEINSPPINISLSIVNFLEIIEAQHDWDRLNIGDIIKVKHDKLGIFIQTKIIEIDFDYESYSIGLTISNSNKVETPEEQFARTLYKVDRIVKDYGIRKVNWQSVVSNFNIRNDRIKELPTNPTVASDGTAIKHKDNDDGSVDVIFTWSYPKYETTKNNADFIDGFIVYLFSSTSSDKYVFGSLMANETMVNLSSDKRSYTFPSMPANRYYTIGIRAYRSVDADINDDGILLSNIVTSTLSSDSPYLPKTAVFIKGDLEGKLNGVTHRVSDIEPSLPQVNDTWLDTLENKNKVYNGLEWVVMSASNADTLKGYSPDVNNTANTIPIRNEVGVINASISGNAETLDGKNASDFILTTEKASPSGVATLDTTGNVPLNQLTNVSNTIPILKSGNYIGDGTQSIEINIGMLPTFVKVYTTKSDDYSVYINSQTGGFLIKNGTVSSFLEGVGVNLDEDSDIYGKLSANGFITGSSVDTFINKLNVKYFWEAIKIPT